MNRNTNSNHINKTKISLLTKTSFVILVILLLQPVLRAQSVHPWNRFYGGSSYENAYDIQQTTDGGFIAVGITSSFGNGSYDIWVLKTNASGDSLWSKTYGGSDYDYAYGIKSTSDGGYIIVGYTSSFGAGGTDVWLLKTNADGDSLWSHTYGGPNSDYGRDVIQTDDGGYLISAYTNSFGAGSLDAWLVKTDEDGNAVWTETYGGSSSDYAWKAVSTDDGGYVFFGVTSSFGSGGYDGWLVKTDSNGDTLWTRTYGGSSDEVAFSGTKVNNGGYVLAGYAISESGTDYDFWILKADDMGDSLWAYKYGDAVTEYGYDVQQTVDGGFVIGGVSYSDVSGNSDYMLLKTDENGISQFTQTYGGEFYDQTQSIQQTSDGGLILAGVGYPTSDNGEFWLVRTEPDPMLALQSFYDNTNGDAWSDNTNWWDGSTTVDNWFGLTMSNGHVTGLSLPNNGVSGTLPADLGNFYYLDSLNLVGNAISGGIPSELGQLDSLRTLNLRLNQLSGTIPSALGQIDSLQSLDLSANQLTGSIPAGLSQIDSLRRLDLSVNQLNGSIPAAMGNLTALEHLNLRENQLSGTIPLSFQNLTSLSFLDLAFNNLSGAIPKELGNLSVLQSLIIDFNNFTGTIPPELGNLTNLESLYLGGNHLAGMVPTELSNLVSLNTFNIQQNLLEDLPNLSSINTIHEMRIEDNRFTFEDIEPNVSISGIVYAPQDSVGEKVDTLVDKGADMDLTVSVGGTNNHYQWYKDDEQISGATGSSYTLESVSFTDIGNYLCKITNTVATDLTLTSRPIVVKVGGAPEVTADSVKSIRDTSAVIYGTINPNGMETTVQLRYGTSTDYGNIATVTQSPFTGTNDQVMSATLGELDPNTEYHVQFEATNSVGTTLSADTKFMTVNKPVVTTDSVTSVSENSAVVHGSVNPNGAATTVKFLYGTSMNNEAEKSITQNPLNGREKQVVSATITGLTSDTDYHFRTSATNIVGTSTGQSQVFTTYTSEYVVTKNFGFATKNNPSDYEATDYRIIGLPGNSNMPLTQIFDGQQGTDWEVYWDNGDPSTDPKDYLVKHDGSNTFLTSPGRAFWAINKGNLDISSLQVSTSQLNAEQQVEIPLEHGGWNLITNPFRQPVQWSDVQGANGNLNQPLWRYDGSESNTLEPFVGYYFDNSGGLSVLKIPYPGIPSLSKGMPKNDPATWRISIRLITSNFIDSSASIGVMPDARLMLDRFDLRKPRAIGERPSVRFFRPDWSTGYPYFATDMRPDTSEMENWQFTVELPDNNGSAALSFKGLESIPAISEIYLVNTEQGDYVSLRDQNLYPISAGFHQGIFRIIAGQHDQVQSELSKIIPKEFQLVQNYPNPFNAGTTIRYGLPEKSKVSLRIYDLRGREVKQLINGETFDAGYHVQNWDGTNQFGQQVSSGVYFYVLQSKNGVLRHKMILLK